MSTTFEVYPAVAAIPTFAELLERSTAELHRFLASVGVDARPPIHVRLLRCEDDAPVPFATSDPARWGDDVYAFFRVGDVPGGTDAYFDADAAAIADLLHGEFVEGGGRPNRVGPLAAQCARVGHRWWFRRSAGQSAAVNVAYGLIAASLADLTGGFVDSSDMAWDPAQLPARPDEFLRTLVPAGVDAGAELPRVVGPVRGLPRRRAGPRLARRTRRASPAAAAERDRRYVHPHQRVAGTRPRPLNGRPLSRRRGS